jgi:hypothetical protein
VSSPSYVEPAGRRVESESLRRPTTPIPTPEAYRSDVAPEHAPTGTTEKDRSMPTPKSYRTIEEFEREELSSQNKAGFSLDDLMQETMLHQNDLLFDDQRDEYSDKDDDDY